MRSTTLAFRPLLEPAKELSPKMLERAKYETDLGGPKAKVPSVFSIHDLFLSPSSSSCQPENRKLIDPILENIDFPLARTLALIELSPRPILSFFQFHFCPFESSLALQNQFSNPSSCRGKRPGELAFRMLTRYCLLDFLRLTHCDFETCSRAPSFV